MLIRNFILSHVFLSGLLAAQSVQAQDATLEEQPSPCRGEADYIFPSITLAPTTDVLVGDGEEFQSEWIGGTLMIRHTGESKKIRFPSIVAIGKHVALNLKNDGTQYCFVSTVALLGGSIKLKGAPEFIGTVSTVGDVRIAQ